MIHFETDTRVTFTYHGNADVVELVGDLNCWREGSHVLQQTAPDCWQITFDVLPATRSDYAFRVTTDGKTQDVLDPDNPHTTPNPFGTRSELRAPGFVPISIADVPLNGKRDVLRIKTKHLPGTREVIGYIPSAPAPEGGYAMIVAHDGGDSEKYLDLPRIVESLIAAGKIPPTMCVMMPPIDRWAEYMCNPAHVAYVVEDVMPQIRKRYNVTTRVDRTVVLGASMGGLISVYIALKHPDVFGLVAAQSGAYIPESGIIQQYWDTDRVPVRYHLCCGLYETRVGTKWIKDLVVCNRDFSKALAGRGYSYVYTEHPDGHAWRYWQRQVPTALKWLLR
jgi:enterochelin esterase-like enzyme